MRASAANARVGRRVDFEARTLGFLGALCALADTCPAAACGASWERSEEEKERQRQEREAEKERQRQEKEAEKERQRQEKEAEKERLRQEKEAEKQAEREAREAERERKAQEAEVGCCLLVVCSHRSLGCRGSHAQG